MGCCIKKSDQFINALNGEELSCMMNNEKEIYKRDLRYIEGHKEKMSFLLLAVQDIERYAQEIKDCDFKEKMPEINKIVNNFFIAIKTFNQTQYEHEKMILEVFLSHNNVLEF